MNTPTCFLNTNPDHGFQFPGVFELSAMGPVDAGLEHELPALLEAAGIIVRHDKITTRASSGGRYVSVRIVFEAKDRAQYDAAHVALRSHPEVRWTV